MEYFHLHQVWITGVLTRSVKDAAIVVDNMKGLDPKDMTSWDSSNMHLHDACTGDVNGKKLCYIKELCNIENYPNADDELKMHLENFHKTVEICKSLGMTVEEVSVDRKLLNAIFRLILNIETIKWFKKRKGNH